MNPHGISIGDTFDTPFERGCVVTTLPDAVGNFDALDSEGIECAFHVRMIVLLNGFAV
jgi:hypothetical protein